MSEHMRTASEPERMLSPQWKQHASSENEVQSGDHFETGATAYHIPGASSRLPSSSAQRTASALTIQRTMGNKAFIQRMGFDPPLHRSIKISSPNDAHEREAESTADRVMAMGEPEVSRQGEPVLGRMSSEEEEGHEVSRKPDTDLLLQNAASNGQDATLQRSADEHQLQSEGIGEDALPDPGPGRPLDPEVRSFMEPRFGASFEGVQIHTGSEAARSATAVNSLAYTRGESIVFGEGQYAPESSTGRRLIAHELTHVVQGGGARGEGHRVRSEAKRAAMVSESIADDLDRQPEPQQKPIECVTNSDASRGSADRRLNRKEKEASGALGLSADARAALIVSTLGQKYQTLMEMQIRGLDDLIKNYNTPDLPSMSDDLIKSAIEMALTAAFTAIAGPLAGKAASMVVGRITAPAISQALQLGSQAAIDVVVKDYERKTAAVTSTITNAIGKGVHTSVTAAFDKNNNGAKDAFESFCESQKDALILGKDSAQDAINDRANEFTGPCAVQMAEALEKALHEMAVGNAKELQYMASLSQWLTVSNSAGGEGMVALTLSNWPKKGGAHKISEAHMSVNSAIKGRIQKNSKTKGFPMSTFDVPLMVTLQNTGDVQNAVVGTTHGSVKTLPAGYGKNILWEYFMEKPYVEGERDRNEPTLEEGAMMGGRVLLINVAQMTWGSLPTFKQ